MGHFLAQTFMYFLSYMVSFLEGVLKGVAYSFGVYLFLRWILL